MANTSEIGGPHNIKRWSVSSGSSNQTDGYRYKVV